MIALRLARLIANNLDGRWNYSDGYLANNSEAFLDGPDGERIKLSLGNASHRKSDHGRLFLTGEFDDLGSHIPYGVPDTYVITVADSTLPAKIAEHISSRLLPAYVKTLHVARDAKRVADEEATAHASLVKLVAERLGVRRRGESTMWFGSIHGPVDGKVKVQRGNTESVFTVRVSRDYVADFADIVGEFLHRHRNRTAA